jgi:hypothetical protein
MFSMGLGAWVFLGYITLTFMGSPNHEDAWIFVLGVPVVMGVIMFVIDIVIVWVLDKITG